MGKSCQHILLCFLVQPNADDQNLQSFTAENKIIIFDKKLQFVYPGPSWRTSQLQEKPPALKREYPALQNMKLKNFFLFLWVIFALLGPDPVDRCQCESGSTTPRVIRISFNADPDPSNQCGCMRILVRLCRHKQKVGFWHEKYILYVGNMS